MKRFRLYHLLILPVAMGFAFFSPVFSPDTSDCLNPKELKALEITDSSALITWRTPDSIEGVSLRWKFMEDTIWTEIDTASSPFSLVHNGACSVVEVELKPLCVDTESEYRADISFSADGCCRVPSNIRAEMRRNTFAIVKWDNVQIASEYIFRIKAQEDNIWTEATVSADSIILEDLMGCTLYEVELVSQCPGENSDTSEVFYFATTGCGVCTRLTYCPSEGLDAYGLWIDSISVAGFNLSSGFDDGYMAMETEQITLERGRDYHIYVTPGFAADTCPQYVRLWLDLDQDASFNDSVEMILDTLNAGGDGLRSVISLPDTLLRGIIRMRISMKSAELTDTIGPDPCEIFNYGEVEDYCIGIDDVCPDAEELRAEEVTEESAVILWEQNDKAFGYIYSYAAIGDNPDEPMLTGDTMAVLMDLSKCTEYEFMLIHACNQDTVQQSLLFKTKCETRVDLLSDELVTSKVYPNPFSNHISFELESKTDLEGHLYLYHMNGQLMFREAFGLRARTPETRTLQVARNWSAGIYLLSIVTDQGTFTRKLIKAEN